MGWCIVFDVLIFIITYPMTCVVDVIIWMFFIIPGVFMYFLMRLCIFYSFMIVDIMLKIKTN